MNMFHDPPPVRNYFCHLPGSSSLVWAQTIVSSRFVVLVCFSLPPPSSRSLPAACAFRASASTVRPWQDRGLLRLSAKSGTSPDCVVPPTTCQQGCVSHDLRLGITSIRPALQPGAAA